VTTTFVNMVVAPIRCPSRKEQARQKMFQAGRDVNRACANALDSLGQTVQAAGAAVNGMISGQGSRPAAGHR
jgi:hypothetical protein